MSRVNLPSLQRHLRQTSTYLVKDEDSMKLWLNNWEYTDPTLHYLIICLIIYLTIYPTIYSLVYRYHEEADQKSHNTVKIYHHANWHQPASKSLTHVYA